LRLKEIITQLEDLAPGAYQEDYDNVGLLVGDPEREVKKGLICLDCTEDVLEEAIRESCDLIICHHPVIFTGLKQLTGSTYVERIVMRAIKNDIAIFASHTNLDSVSHGVSDKLAKELGLNDTKVLQTSSGKLLKLYTFCPAEQADQVRQAIFNAGAGQIGDYSECSYNVEGFGTYLGGPGTNPMEGKAGERQREPEVKMEMILPAHLKAQVIQALVESHPYEEVAYDLIALENTDPRIGFGMIGVLNAPMETSAFLDHVKKTLHADGIRYTKTVSDKVHRIAVCGGSGSFLINDAIRAGADVFVTADIKYHQFFDADERILLVDVGHYESEQFTKDLIYDALTKKIPNFALLFSQINTNPINYL
jgi:dinuclear metal center YbgI/SA1388 family protein